MELIVFDLDGTLLNKRSEISDFTRDTLIALREHNVAYTVATGRTLHAARDLLQGHDFLLPQAYKNGVMIWQPDHDDYSHRNVLTLSEIEHVLEAVMAQDVTPFIFTLEPGNRHAIYHTPLRNDIERRLAKEFSQRNEVEVLPASELPAAADITNISALGAPRAIGAVATLVKSEPGLVGYSGTALEGDDLDWIDIHHSDASKGGAIDILREQLGATRVLCFGDGDNDLSMFARADEAYAPDNARADVKAAATAVIGHHDQDGIARFLRERFDL